MPRANEFGMKICSTCRVEQSITQFSKYRSAVDGLQSQCKECKHKYATSVEGRQVGLKYCRKYRAEHREASRESGRKYRENHLEERREASRLCARRIRKERPQEVHAQARQSLLFTKYGMTVSDYDRMFEQQKGVCAICGKEQTHSPVHNGYLCIDHDHVTGKNRGLLCRKCNIALGHVDDNVEVLEKMIAYIKAGGMVVLANPAQ
jgi:uncharacterized protein YaiL (DUF2058 family)